MIPHPSNAALPLLLACQQINTETSELPTPQIVAKLESRTCHWWLQQRPPPYITLFNVIKVRDVLRVNSPGMAREYGGLWLRAKPSLLEKHWWQVKCLNGLDWTLTRIGHGRSGWRGKVQAEYRVFEPIAAGVKWRRGKRLHFRVLSGHCSSW